MIWLFKDMPCVCNLYWPKRIITVKRKCCFSNHSVAKSSLFLELYYFPSGVSVFSKEYGIVCEKCD